MTALVLVGFFCLAPEAWLTHCQPVRVEVVTELPRREAFAACAKAKAILAAIDPNHWRMLTCAEGEANGPR